MDLLISILVYIIAKLSGLAPLMSRLGLMKYSRWDGSGKFRILLVGYNGARNTGADVRVAAMTRQIESVLGKDNIEISIMTLDTENVAYYFGLHIRLIHFSSIFFWDLFKACSEAHMAVLCEGSTLKSTFANALTLYFCEAAGIMKQQRKLCIAYGSEAGWMDDFLRRTVKSLCSDTYFIARTQESLRCIKELGLNGHLGTDTAWTFDSSSHTEWAKERLMADGWDGQSPLLGVAPINPFWWPVKPSLGKWILSALRQNKLFQFEKWYFFSWSKDRAKAFEAYIDALAQNVNQASKAGQFVVIIGMERLDADACRKLASKLTVPTAMYLAGDHNGYEIAAILRRQSMLITSRYHAQVLSMEGCVPSVAVSMDERLENIMAELGMSQHQLLHVDDPELCVKLRQSIEYVQSQHADIRRRIAEKLPDYKSTMADMGRFFAEQVRKEQRKVQVAEDEVETYFATGKDAML